MDGTVIEVDILDCIKKAQMYEDIKRIAECYDLDAVSKIKAIKEVVKDENR